MDNIKRLEVDEFWADSTVIEAGEYIFVGYCRRMNLILSAAIACQALVWKVLNA